MLTKLRETALYLLRSMQDNNKDRIVNNQPVHPSIKQIHHKKSTQTSLINTFQKANNIQNFWFSLDTFT